MVGRGEVTFFVTCIKTWRRRGRDAEGARYLGCRQGRKQKRVSVLRAAPAGRNEDEVQCAGRQVAADASSSQPASQPQPTRTSQPTTIEASTPPTQPIPRTRPQARTSLLRSLMISWLALLSSSAKRLRAMNTAAAEKPRLASCRRVLVGGRGGIGGQQVAFN